MDFIEKLNIYRIVCYFSFHRKFNLKMDFVNFKMSDQEIETQFLLTLKTLNMSIFIKWIRKLQFSSEISKGTLFTLKY